MERTTTAAVPDKPHYRYDDGLESERLVTRFLVHADYPLWEAFYLRSENFRFLPNLGGKTALDNARLAIERQLQRYQQKTYGLQALIEKSSGNIVGQCGLLTQEVHGRQELEIGYQLFDPYWGKGYATEAARLFRDYGFEALKAESIISLINIENYASQRVAERNGMKQSDQIKYMGQAIYIYRISRDEWQNM